MTSLWDMFMPLIKKISTPEMLEDLAFYREHDRELYFNGLTTAAAIFTIIEIFFFVTAAFYLFHATDHITLAFGLVFVGFAVVTGIGFDLIKLYLHVRKDAIEIKEMLKKCSP